MMSAIDLLLDEENELTFELNIEGTRPAEAACRLSINNNNDMTLLFEAKDFSGGEVNVVLPPLNHVLKEGVYDMSLEVIVDDKFFKPLTLKGNFEKSVKVTAESVVRKPRKKATATAKLINSGKRNIKSRQITEAPKKNIKTNRKDISDQDILNIIRALSNKK